MHQLANFGLVAAVPEDLAEFQPGGQVAARAVKNHTRAFAWGKAQEGLNWRTVSARNGPSIEMTMDA